MIRSLAFSLLLLGLAACQTDYRGEPLKVDLNRTFYGCQLNKTKDAVAFKHPGNQCSVAAKYLKTEIPLKYVSACTVDNKRGGSGRGVISMKVSYPDFQPIPAISSENYVLEKDTVQIEIITRPCDIYKRPTDESNAIDAEYRVSREQDGKKVYREKYLGNNIYLYEKLEQPGYNDAVYKQYIIKNNEGAVIHSIPCDQNDRCHSYTQSPDRAYFYDYSFIKTADIDFLEMKEAVVDFASGFFAKQSNENFKGELDLNISGEHYQITGLPKFEEYPAEAASKQIASDIDWASHKNAWNFRTRLREGLKKGANYNGHYAVITHGCGSPCQVNWIVNVNTGKVIGNISTALGAQYKLDSSLIAADLVDDARIGAEIEAEALYLRYIKFYKVENDKLVPVNTLDIYGEIEKLKAEKAH